MNTVLSLTDLDPLANLLGDWSKTLNHAPFCCDGLTALIYDKSQQPHRDCWLCAQL